MLIGDEPFQAGLAEKLPADAVEWTVAATVGEALECLKNASFDAALLDLGLPDRGILDTLDLLVAAAPFLPIVILTDRDDEALATEMLRRGAQDIFVQGKPNGTDLLRSVCHACARKEAEHELRLSETKYRTVFYSNRDAVITFTPEGNVLSCNPAAVELFHFHDELDFQSCTPLSVSSETQPDGNPSEKKIPEMIAIAIEKGSHFFEWTYRRKDGTSFIASELLTRMEVEGRTLLQATIRDISSQKLAEDALRREKQWSEFIINSLPGTFFILDERGTFLRWNKNFEVITGYTPDEIERLTATDLFAGSDKNLVTQRIGDAFKDGMASMEADLVCKDGRTIPFYFTGLRMMSANRPLAIGMGFDISEQKQIEEKLRFANAVLQTQQETSPDGILVVGENSRAISFNQRFLDIWGLSADYVQAEPDEQILQAVLHNVANPQEFLARIKYLYENHDEKSREEILFTDGRTYERYSAPMVGSDGKYYGRVWYFHDITEQKRAEEAIRQEQQFTKQVLKSLPGIFYLYSYPENRLVLWNKQHESLLGFDAEEMQGRFIADWHVPEARDAVLKAVDDAMEQGYNLVETPLIAKDGRQIPFLLTGVRFEAQGRLFLMGIGVDISERKQTEEALSKAREEIEKSARLQSELIEKLNEAQEVAKIGSWDWDIETNEVWWSDETYRLFGVSPNTYTPNFQSNMQFVHQDDQELYQNLFDHSIKAGVLLDCELRIVAGDGAVKFCKNLGRCSYDSSGKPLRFVGTIMDITERKRTEKELADAKTLLEQTFEQTPVPMVLVSMPDQVVRYVNTACRRFYDIIDQPNPVGIVISEYRHSWKDFDKDANPITEWPVLRAMRGETTKYEEFCAITKDGATRWGLASASPIFNAAGEMIAAFAAFPEITERKRAEDELRKYREHLEELVDHRTAELILARDQARAAETQAEAANRAKSVFLASMSHELRTPLNAVLGFSQLMRTDPMLNDSQKENLDIINRSGTHLLGLINDVLQISRIEAGQVEKNESDFDLWNMLDTIQEMMCSRVKAKRLRFFQERDPSLPRYIRADERKLKQVILNLTGNAVKFTQMGSITLRANAAKHENVLLFEIEDTGAGMDSDTVAKLFEPFAQGSLSQEGVGLGLFISKKLVKLMGGEIDLRSEQGKGTLFSFSICYEPATASEKTTHVVRRVTKISQGQPSPCILVVEDTLESRLLMVKSLQATGFNVIEASNGNEAVQLSQENSLDLILMDMRMPVMDGYQAIAKIRSAPQEKTIPIIAVTASAFDEERQNILAIGADDFVRKPVQLEEIYEKIRLLLGISYDYVDESVEDVEAAEQVDMEALVAELPMDLANQLACKITVLDLDGFKALLPQVREHAPALAEMMMSMANGFKMTELAELFSKAKEKNACQQDCPPAAR